MVESAGAALTRINKSQPSAGSYVDIATGYTLYVDVFPIVTKTYGYKDSATSGSSANWTVPWTWSQSGTRLTVSGNQQYVGGSSYVFIEATECTVYYIHIDR